MIPARLQDRTERVSALATTMAFLRRDWRVARSYRLAFVLDFGSTLFQILLFFFLSQLFDRAGLARSAGLEQGYFSFAVVGLVMMRIIDTSLRTFAQNLRNEQITGTFEVLMTTPTPLPSVVLGSATYNLVYGTAVGIAMLVMAMLLGAPLIVSAAAVTAAAVAFLATLAIFAAVGVVVAAAIVVVKQGMSLIGLVTQFLSLLGGVYFPVTVFPDRLQALARLLPFKWSLDVLRAALLEGRVLWGWLVLLLAVAAVSVPASLWVLRRAVDRARRAGSLAQY